MNLNEIIDEMLSFEKIEIKKPTFGSRIHSFLHRKEIEKQLQDEQQFENDKVLKLGSEAENFLKSDYYKDLIEPQIRQAIKGGIQKLILNGEDLTEVQIKSELAIIKKMLSVTASLRLKIINAKVLKEKSK